MSLEQLFEALKGGPGSGNWGHSGRPGVRGGSAPRPSFRSSRDQFKFDQALQRQTLKKVESKIRNQAYESLAIVDSKGKILAQQDGSKSEIVLNRDSVEALKGNVLTHNHPSGTSFSPADIMTAATHHATEVRAVSKNWDHSMKIISPIKDTQQLQDTIDFHNTNVKGEFWPKINMGEMTIEEANSKHWHEVWQRVVNEYPNNLEYRRYAVK